MFRGMTLSWLLLIALMPTWVIQARAQSHSKSEAASARQDYKKEFEEVCSKTQDSMILSLDELATLVKRCDALVPKIEKLDDTQKKVYMKRLVQCRGLYAYVLDSRRNEKK